MNDPSRMAPLTGGVSVRESGYQVKELVPVEDPIAVRDAFLRDFVQQGMAPRDAERLAVAGLQIADAFQRDAQPVTGPVAPPPARAPGAAAEHGATLVADGSGVDSAERGKVLRPSVLHQRASRRSEKWGYAVGRLARITQGIVPVFATRGPKAELDLKASCATAGVPKLAERYYRLWGNMIARHQQRTARWNPFWGKSEADCLRIFESEVYGICDASTGVLGQWWVPK